MSDRVTVDRVEFHNFKAFSRFSLPLGKLSILVGPNNSGKSTILSSFRVLAAGIRRANAKSATLIQGPQGPILGHIVPTEDLPISLENAHTNYRTDVSTTIAFHLSNRNTLTLYFPPEGEAVLIPQAHRPVKTPSTFREQFPIKIEAIPVLGPVEHKEDLVEKRTVQRGLVTHRASRHFRNYWYHFPESFTLFASAIEATWPEMRVNQPELVDYEFLAMFCTEDRMERELYWAGFGFQVWCQLLTHIVRSSDADLLVVDEPEIYLHPDLQRRLLTVLRDAGPDVLLATHSTELVSEAEPSEIVIIDKGKKSAQRLKNIDQVQTAVEFLGSNQNVTLTQLARTQRVLVVEGMDFKILGRFAQQVGLIELASKFDFTVVPIGGFSQWPNLRTLTLGIETALGKPLRLGAIFDRDFRCDEEITSIEADLSSHVAFLHFHKRKELENYLLVPSVLDRAIKSKLYDRSRRTGSDSGMTRPAADLLDEISNIMRAELLGQYVSSRTEYIRGPSKHSSTVAADAYRIFEEKWADLDTRMEIVPGKEVFSQLNRYLGENYHISLTPTAVISHFRPDEVPRDLMVLLKQMDRFRKTQTS